MEFHFSIRSALKESWQIFKEHAAFFIVLALVVLILNLVSQNDNWILSILITIAGVVWSYVWLSVSLAAVDGKKDLLQFSSLTLHLPTFKQFLRLIGVGIIAGVIILVGFILLIIPGIYFMTRLAFSNLSYVDRKEGIRESLRYSWHLVTKQVFWTVLLTIGMVFALVIVGVILFGVGFLIAYPLAMLLITKLYRALTHNHPPQEMIVQPEEIPAHTETVHTEERE